MATFVGRYDRQLDPKGRLALPASFRQKFEHLAYLTIGKNACVAVYTPEEHEAMVQDLRDKERQGEIDTDLLRARAARTFEVPIDGQGRILLDAKLRDYADVELGTKVTVLGVYDRIEIWNSDAIDAIEVRGSEGFKQD